MKPQMFALGLALLSGCGITWDMGRSFGLVLDPALPQPVNYNGAAETAIREGLANLAEL